MAVANPSFGALVPIAGASDREGRSRRNRHHWIAPSRGIIPIVLILIIAAPQGFNFVPFSGSLLYSNANPIQADDGSDRGPAQGLSRWAKASVGSGDRWRRASRARGPSPTSFGVLGQARARQSFLGPDKSGWRVSEDVLSECAPHPAHAPYLTHPCSRMRVRARHRCLQHAMGAAAEVLAQLRRTLRESSRERRVGDGAGGSSSEAGRAHVGDGPDGGDRAHLAIDSGWRLGGLTYDRRPMTRAGVELWTAWGRGLSDCAFIALQYGPSHSRWSSRRA